MAASDPVLEEFANEFQFCAVCWARDIALHIHHLQQGAGRVHDRRCLLRLCMYCHDGLHSGGRYDLTKGHMLTVKRECDDRYYDPQYLASLRRKVHLGYGPAPLPEWALNWRDRHGIPVELAVMAINSRQKGKAGELEAKDALNAVLPLAHARRSQQHSGTESSSDLIAPGLPNLWIEVKRVQSMNVTAVMAKAREQAGGMTPVILHRKNNEEWLVTIPLRDLPSFVSQAYRAM